MSDNRLEDAFDAGYMCAEGLIEDKGILQIRGMQGKEQIDYQYKKYVGAERKAWCDGFDECISERDFFEENEIEALKYEY